MKKPDLCTVCLMRPQALAGIVNTGVTGFFVKASWYLSDCKWFTVVYEVTHPVQRSYLYFWSSSVQYIAICKYFILRSSRGVSCQMILPLPFWARLLSCLGPAGSAGSCCPLSPVITGFSSAQLCRTWLCHRQKWQVRGEQELSDLACNRRYPSRKAGCLKH